jgi:hAT family C-terminal dimerisation region
LGALLRTGPITFFCRVIGLTELNDRDWKLLKVVAQVLEVFKVASQPLCGAKYPTLNSAVPVYNYLFDELESFLGMRNSEAGCREKAAIISQCDPDDRHALTDALQAAYEQVRSYYSDVWADMYAIAVILDPRLKLDYYKNNNWERKLVNHAKRALLRAIGVYGAAMPPSTQSEVVAYPGPVEERAFGGVVKRRCVEKESELGAYLSGGVAAVHEDILAWWERHVDAYPCLARIAREYLAISATSVPSERVFSGGADLITDKRGSLNEDTIRACMCLKSWL